MATKSFVTRLKALEEEYRSRIDNTFEKLRAIEVQPYYDEMNELSDPQKAKVRKAAVKAFSDHGITESDVDFYDYRDNWRVNITFYVKKDGGSDKIRERKKELEALIDAGRKKFCPIEEGYHRRLHEWKERCLVDGEIYAFESPSVDDLDKFDSIGCS